MSFIETPRFPDDVSYGSAGGPGFSTTIAEARSGHETRNIEWSQARARFNAALGVRSQQQLDDVLTLYRVAHGRAHGFRYKDWSDFRVTGTQGILIATGVAGTYQMYKRYSFGGLTYDRLIQKPVAASIVLLGGGTADVDGATGLVSNIAGTVTGWTGEFDVPVRFDSDEFSASIDNFETYNGSIDLLEIRV